MASFTDATRGKRDRLHCDRRAPDCAFAHGEGMLTLRRGRVTAVRERHSGLARLEVDGRPCVAYPRLTGPVALGDEVVVNTQALDLGLGSGGFDVLHTNLTRRLQLPRSGSSRHEAALHATPGGRAPCRGGSELPSTLAGLPVVGCTLHSQVVPACAGLGPGKRVAYVQVEGGALPITLSDALRALRQHGLIEATVAVGACLDGDVSCVTPASALAWARREGFDAVVCDGPGVVGTGSFLGHGGLAVGAVLWAAASLQGRPILAPRVSLADERERHRGISHHSRAVAPSAATRSPSPGLPASRPRPASRWRSSTWRSGARPAPNSPSRRWGAGPTRIPGFSPPPSRPGGWLQGCCREARRSDDRL